MRSGSQTLYRSRALAADPNAKSNQGFVRPVSLGHPVELSNEVDDLCRIVLIEPESSDLKCGRFEFIRLLRSWFYTAPHTSNDRFRFAGAKSQDWRNWPSEAIGARKGGTHYLGDKGPLNGRASICGFFELLLMAESVEKVF